MASESSDSVLLTAVRAVAISPEKAMQQISQYKASARKRNSEADDEQIEDIVSAKIIAKYARYTALSGGVFALPGIVPGVGTVAAAVGGGAGDAVACLKAQVDMTMLLAANFGWDLTELDAQHLAMLIAVSSGLEKLGVQSGAPVASKAGVKMLRQYLTGTTLTALKQFFNRFGVTFTRTALEKAFPFGVGVVAGSSLNYLLTRYVGAEAVKCFKIDREMRMEAGG